MATQKMEEVKEQHVIRLTGVPYGFFEKEMQGYFSQFGHVKRVRVVRNKRGHHNGIAFVEFKNAEVAKIVAKTMDNYLLAEKRLRCRVLEQERVPNSIKRGKLFAKIVKPGENHLKHAKERFKLKTPEHVEYQRTRFVETLRARMEKIRERGINYEFNFEEKLRKFLECKRETTEEDGMEEGEEVGKIGKGEAVDMKLMGGGGGGEEMVVENIQGKGA